MKRISVIILVSVFAYMSAFAWGRYGHGTVAQIAENNLTPTAKAKINEIMKGESFVPYASYADRNKNEKFLRADYGEGLTDGTKRYGAYPHTFEAGKGYKPFRGTNDNGRYVKNCIFYIEKLAAELKDYKNMDETQRWRNLVLIVHFVGDMHCPEHMRYNPGDMTIGYYKVLLCGDSLRYHTYWDDQVVIRNFGTDIQKNAKDFATWNAKTVKKVVKGTPYDWGKDAAKCCEYVHEVKPGAVLDEAWVKNSAPLAQSQLTKAGYRLAELLNRIFE